MTQLDIVPLLASASPKHVGHAARSLLGSLLAALRPFFCRFKEQTCSNDNGNMSRGHAAGCSIGVPAFGDVSLHVSRLFPNSPSGLTASRSPSDTTYLGAGKCAAGLGLKRA
eukprot:CAMPEP_0206587960 /NCGR_PEP_ID=MMETSP0325_2-20121206/37976_1 /ASSEMBLY_ACC=CAM_ASM_000347 /TAXON_ID=2866 /ORGANISM="Crypthecodinium cohnii, Strain Seligo" /LENGTH=111 /DNA_ID=CAMNT_0054096103 /DNA_START=16 /DNA_END=347 /DNA_ORIENTATION=+